MDERQPLLGWLLRSLLWQVMADAYSTTWSDRIGSGELAKWLAQTARACRINSVAIVRALSGCHPTSICVLGFERYGRS
jgi:hypothetical protein